jgi:hypothetical protein
MIGGIDEPRVANRCNRCRFWQEHMPLRDPNDEDWGFGECRRNPPVLISCLVGLQVDRPRFGQQTDLDVDPLNLSAATRFPVSTATDWCGRFSQREA